MKLIKLIYLMTAAFFLSQQICQSQEDKNAHAFIFLNNIGFSEYEIENTSTSNALLYGISITKDFYLSEKIYLNTGLGLDNYFFNQDVNNITFYSKSKFINIPLRVKLLKKSGQNSFFTTIGIISSYKIEDKLKNNISDANLKGEKGFNFSSNISFGFTYSFSEKISMILGVDYLTDFASLDYRRASLRNNQVSFNLGFEFKI